MKQENSNFDDAGYIVEDKTSKYDKVIVKIISTLATKEQYARVSLKGMPNPTGKVYRDKDIEEPKTLRLFKKFE